MSKVDKFITMFVEFRFSGFPNLIQIKENFVLRVNDLDIAKYVSLYLRHRKTFDLILHTD